MQLKNCVKSTKVFLLNLIIHCVLAVLTKTNRRFRRDFAFSVARIILKFFPRTMSRAIANIISAMPHLSECEVRKLAIASYQNIVFGVLECFWLDEIEFDFEISPSAKIILHSARGASVATMHMGCHEAVPFALQKLTKRSSTLSTTPPFLSCAKDLYEKVGVECFDNNDPNSFVCLLNAIKQQRVVSLHSDHYATNTELSFSKRLTGAPCGAAMLSAYGRVPLLLSYSILQESGKYKLIVETLSIEPVFPDKEAIRKVTAEVYKKFEEVILQHPEHWNWSYRRWR